MRALKKGALIIDQSVRIACIDDFAFRKGQTYGTVLINIETRNVVDILGSRDYEDVRNWLKTFPDLEVVSRDGSITFHKAIRSVNKNIVQISDRFHLLKNLTEYAKGYIKRVIPIYLLQEIETTDNCSSEFVPSRKKYQYKTKWELIQAVQNLRLEGHPVNYIAQALRLGNRTVSNYLEITPEEESKYSAIPILKTGQPTPSQKSRKAMLKTIRTMLSEGYSKPKIAEVVGKSVRTVNRALLADPNGNHGSAKKRGRSKLDPYRKEILNLSMKGQSSLKIFKQIKAKGYDGSASLIREFILKETTKNNASMQQKNYQRIERQSIISLLYKEKSHVKGLNDGIYSAVLDQYPELKLLLKLVKDFKDLLFGEEPHKLDVWIESVKKTTILELLSFVQGIHRDILAVKNSIIYPYSNGLAEGTVNKIKVIKRIMYGRCGFQMLRRKILLNQVN